MKYASEHELVNMLRTLVKETSTRTVAKQLGITHSRISEFINGKRRLNPAAITALGYDGTRYYAKARKHHG